MSDEYDHELRIMQTTTDRYLALLRAEKLLMPHYTDDAGLNAVLDFIDRLRVRISVLEVKLAKIRELVNETSGDEDIPKYIDKILCKISEAVEE